MDHTPEEAAYPFPATSPLAIRPTHWPKAGYPRLSLPPRMAGMDLVLLLIVVALAAYLLYALVRAERF